MFVIIQDILYNKALRSNVYISLYVFVYLQALADQTVFLGNPWMLRGNKGKKIDFCFQN